MANLPHGGIVSFGVTHEREGATSERIKESCDFSPCLQYPRNVASYYEDLPVNKELIKIGFYKNSLAPHLRTFKNRTVAQAW